MEVISILAAGVAGAGGGEARLFERGTEEPLTWYETFAGDSAHADGVVELNAMGRAEVYINAYADMRVFSSLGALVLECTLANSANLVEYVGPAFTGEDYPPGVATGVNKPVTLKEILDRWNAETGNVDWKVTDADGNVATIDNLFSRKRVFFNVADYGADTMAADNLAAFNAAITAAADSGGVVFVPGEAYEVSQAITLNGVGMLGAPASEIVTSDPTPSGKAVVIVGTGFIRGIKITVGTTNNVCLTMSSVVSGYADDCIFSKDDGSEPVVDVEGDLASVRGCRWLTTDSTLLESGLNTNLYMANCMAEHGSATVPPFIVPQGYMTGVVVENGIGYAQLGTASRRVTLVGCIMRAELSETTRFNEFGCNLLIDNQLDTSTNYDTVSWDHAHGSRLGKSGTVADGDVDGGGDVARYETIFCSITTAHVAGVLPEAMPPGTRLTYIIYNGTAGSLAFDFDSSVVVGDVADLSNTTAAGETFVFSLVSILFPVGSAERLRWAIIAKQVV